jgi:hypothetical protein
MQRYVNLRAWWNEPYNMLYFIPGLQVLYNVADESFSVAPEFNYNGIDNMNIRLRASVPVGDELSEWGEKPNKFKIELRLRYYF